MPGKVLVSNDYITVEYLPDEQLIYHVIHQPIGPEQSELFKEALEAGTAALQQYRASKWLSDDRKNGPLPPETLQWAFDDWQPRTIAAGWKYWANVVPTELVAAGTLIPVIENLHRLGLKMQVFTKPEDAFQWLAKF
jgi:hypothetical protein